MRKSYDSSGTAYFDEQERLFYRSYYVSHGSHFRFYLYKDEVRLWACMEVCSQAYNSFEDDNDIRYGNEFFFYLFQK